MFSLIVQGFFTFVRAAAENGGARPKLWYRTECPGRAGFRDAKRGLKIYFLRLASSVANACMFSVKMQ